MAPVHFKWLIRPDPAAVAEEDLRRYLSVLPPVMLHDYGGIVFDHRRQESTFSGAAGHSYSQNPYLGEASMNRSGHNNRSAAFFDHWSKFWPVYCQMLRERYLPTSPLAVQASGQSKMNPRLTHLILESGVIFPLLSPARKWSAQGQTGWEPELLRRPVFHDGEYRGSYFSYCPEVVVENILVDGLAEDALVAINSPSCFLVHPWLGDMNRNWLTYISDQTLTQVAVRWVKVCEVAVASASCWSTPLLIHSFDEKKVWIVSPAGEIEEYVLPVN